jgi:hypothetical protein
MSTISFKRAHGLTVAQHNAVDLLASGLYDAAVAERIGITRSTVTRWRLYDPGFLAALNARRAELWSGAADGLRAAMPVALDTVREQLSIGSNRSRLALDLLTRSGLMGKPQSGALGLTGTAGGPFGIGPTTMEGILDAEVRRVRAQHAAADGDESLLPPVDAPITEDEREAAYVHLKSLAGDDTDSLDPPGDTTPVVNGSYAGP